MSEWMQFGRVLPLLGVCVIALLAGCANAQPPGPGDEWTLTFSDEFDGDAIDTTKWEVITRRDSQNNEKQYYLPEQAQVIDGVLRITSTNEPLDGKLYRSARVKSWFTQRYGRFEARAKVASTKGIWPAFWLLPRTGNWPHDGEIDIMEHAGSEPARVSCAYHFANADGLHANTHQAYRAKDTDGQPVLFPEGFHVYAVQWSPTEMVFSVDGNEYCRVTHEQVPISKTPMAIILNTAVGGWFDGDTDDTTVFPQHYDIDYVRVYQLNHSYPKPPPEPIKPALVNGDFKEGGKGWKLKSNAAIYPHDLTTGDQQITFGGEGDKALKLYGPFGGPADTTATQDRILARPGKTYMLSAMTRTNADDPVPGTMNHMDMCLQFQDADGNPIPDADARKTVIDADTPTDQWLEQSLSAKAPPNAATLSVVFIFHQHAHDPGAGWVDHVSLRADD